ncbi:MAG TPA: DUF3604 domain-containing protein [Armatimonadota bacterium]|nr:DUF3604 domain-containing protein [Armatimonadota bacterium]
MMALLAVAGTDALAHPLRIPSDVELGVAEPSVARAGEVGSWTFPFVLAEPVSPNEVLWLFVHGGRSIKIAWPGLQVKDESAKGYVSLSRQSGEALKPIGADKASGVFSFAVPADGLAKVERLVAKFTDCGTPQLSEPSKFLVLLKSPPGAKLGPPTLHGEILDRVVGVCVINVTGGAVTSLQAFAPSHAVKGKGISLFVRAEDKYRNTASKEPGTLIVRLDGKEMAVRRVAIPGSKCCRLEDISLPKEGVYRLEVEDASTGMKAITNPVKCGDEKPNLLWGLLHGHTEISDGTASLDNYYTCLRDRAGVDFGAASDHDHRYETSDDMWRMTQQAAIKYNKPGAFTAFLGYEWAKWRKNGDGDRNVYYLHDNRLLYRSDDGDYPRPPDMLKALANETAMVIPHHPAEVGNHCDWKDHDPEKERLVEIYSVWGCSERSASSGNPYPVKGPDKTKLDSGEVPAGFIQRALELGWRVGFSAGSDDHTGHPGEMTKSAAEPFDYQGGLTAVYAKENTREAIWEGLWNRRCYGTTGARMIVDFSLDDHPMGSVLDLSDYKEWSSARKLSLTVHGTARIKSIEIVRNNKDVHTVNPNALDAEFEWTDTDSLEDISLPPNAQSSRPVTFYYLRITQEDGEMAWSSPVWIVSRGQR